MKTSVATTAPEKATAALLAVSVPELDGKLPAPLAAIDKALHGAMGRAMTAGDFTGKDDETALFYPADGPQRVLLVGLGTPDAVDAGAIRKAAAQAGRRATSTGAESIAVYSPPDVVQAVGAESVGQAVVEGAGQGGWTFEELRSERESRSDLAEVVVLGDDADREALERGRVVGDAIAHGQILARNLQMRPGNLCTPAQLAAEAEELGTRHGIAVGVMDLAAIDKEGMNALLAVAQGSAQEPRFITLEYKGDGGAPPVCLVGKGVTFDSGGISIKPALNMEEMKYDMSGAAAVLGAFEALGRLKPKLNVVGLIPATENLPSSTAVKPGDVVTTHLGKTVEIINTDAEGRLVLCDALSYARRFEPACIIDAATLTGAIVIALGDQATGLMGNDDGLIEQIVQAGRRAGEPCWELPLWDGYRRQIKSDTADIKNVGGRPAGSITAGWFLKEFIDECPWAHLDIAGTAWIDRDRPDIAKGPTGVGVRLFAEFLLGRAAG